MAWEDRGGNRYYYRSHRLADGRVVKTYHGSQWDAAMAADADRLKQAERRLAIRRHHELLQHIRRLAEPLEALQQSCDIVLEAALLAAGYHYRGEWRKRHGRQISR